MPALALRRMEHDQPAPTPTKRQRISKELRHACDLLASGECKTVKAAAERSGLSREHLSRMLSAPHIQAFITRESRRTIAVASLRASNRVAELIDAASEHVSLDAAKHVLAIEGIKPASDSQVSVNVGVTVGYVVRLPQREQLQQPVTIDAQMRGGDVEA